MGIVNLARVASNAKSVRKMGNYNPVALVTNSSFASALANRADSAIQANLRKIPGASQVIGSYDFGRLFRGHGRQAGSNPISAGFVYYGYPADLEDIPSEYRIEIRNTGSEKWAVVGILQENFTLKTASEWVPFAPTGDMIPEGINQAIQLGTQITTGLQIKSSLTSRRIWNGTTPVVMSVKLKFQAINDPVNEVLRPSIKLQQLALPAGADPVSFSGFNVPIPFLQPPGPSPAKFGNTSESSQKMEEGGTIGRPGETTEIKIGTMIKFSSVIVKEVEVTYPSKYTAGGYPISAEVNIVFETYEILTKQQLEQSYNQVNIGGSS